MSVGRQVLDRFMERLAAKTVAVQEVLFVGGPLRGEVGPYPREGQVIVSDGGYEYLLTEELAQRRGGTQQVRVARPAEHVKCGFLPLDSLLGGFICVRGHGL